jgi:hypothetical protein
MGQVVFSPDTRTAKLKIVAGEIALDGTNPTPVDVTRYGISTIIGVSLTLKDSSTPGVSTSVLSYASSGGVLSIYAWKVTNSSTTTLIASGGTETVGYVIVGY